MKYKNRGITAGFEGREGVNFAEELPTQTKDTNDKYKI